MHLRTFIIFSVFSLTFGQDRKITSKLNPDCAACSENTTLVYTKAKGSHDIIHQLWDFTRGTPTVIYAVAGLNSSLQVSWFNNKPVQFNMSEVPQYSFAMAISDLYEYNDLNDTGHMDFRSNYSVYPLRDLRWTRQDAVLTEQEAMVQMQADRYRRDRQWLNGTIDIKLDLVPFRDYAAQLPHLIHTANSSLLDVQLVNLTQSRGYRAARLALRLLLVAADAGAMTAAVDKSLDDEHTPGVFEIISVKSPRCVSRGAGGYLQLRPVAYTQPERSVTSSTVLHLSDFNSTRIPDASTLSRFFRYSDAELLVQDVVVSFGEPGDGFYRQHNYTAWSLTIGYGAPPVESFSLFVIVVISLGVSVPALLALAGAARLLASRCRQRQRPQRLADE